ncbi:MAG TPA: ABC transporter substrate-binding protein [Thermoanaerobaculia bacterium]|jgi:branched-chain amino acid transport system substrate-binding protein
MKNKWFVLATALLAVIFTACPPKNEGGGTTATGGGGGDILVGEYGSLSGNQATFGQATHNGIIMAMDEVNAAGGINGRKIKVLTEDDQSKQEEAANAVSKLISQNNVTAVLGEVASSASMAAGPICQSNKVPMITPSSTNEAVTKRGDYIFRVCFIDNYQGPVMARFATQNLKSKRGAILTDVKNDYSTGLTTVIEEIFNSTGGRIVGKQSYSNGDADFRPQLTTIKAANPDVIFIPGYYGDVAQIVSQARDLGIKVPFVGGDGWESPKLLEIGGKAMDGCYYANHYFQGDPAPSVREFVQKYSQRFKVTPGALDALGYDAARVLADAMKRAKTIDGPSIRDAIAETKGFAGVTGVITLGPDRNPVGKKIVVIAIKNGQLTLDTTIDPNAPSGAATATGTTGTAKTSS